MAPELQDARADLVAVCSDSASAQSAEFLVKDLHRVANVCTRVNVQVCSSSLPPYFHVGTTYSVARDSVVRLPS